MSNSETMDRKIAVDPAAEDSYWRQYYGARTYTPAGTLYDDFGPAYGHCVKAFTDNPGRNFNDVESDLSRSWESARDASDRLSDKIERALP